MRSHFDVGVARRENHRHATALELRRIGQHTKQRISTPKASAGEFAKLLRSTVHGRPKAHLPRLTRWTARITASRNGLTSTVTRPAILPIVSRSF